MDVASAAPPFLLLAAGLLTLLASTLQLRLWIRALIWAGGVALLVTGYMLISRNHYGLVAMALDAAAAPDFARSVLGEAIIGNWAGLVGNLGPMFDILLALTTILALVALIALAPGEWLEKAVRPVILCVLGAIGGGFIALALVAAGVGGYGKERVYAGLVRAQDVVDGDTLRMGDVALRLWGIDAPEFNAAGPDARPTARNQFCLSSAGVPTQCGAAARDALAEIVNRKLVVCRPPNPATRRRVDAFGRTVVQCAVRQGAAETDIAEAMIQRGYADIYQDNDDFDPNYRTSVGLARMRRVGMWEGEALSPNAWRNNDRARENFIDRLRQTTLIN